TYHKEHFESYRRSAALPVAPDALETPSIDGNDASARSDAGAGPGADAPSRGDLGAVVEPPAAPRTSLVERLRRAAVASFRSSRRWRGFVHTADTFGPRAIRRLR